MLSIISPSTFLGRLLGLFLILLVLVLLLFPKVGSSEGSVTTEPAGASVINFYLPFSADARSTGKAGVLVSRTGVSYRSSYTNQGLETVEQANCSGVGDKLCLGSGGDYHDYGDGQSIQRAAIDFMLPYDAPVLAVADGTVTQIGQDAKGNPCNVYIRHSDGSTSFYQHLSSVKVEKDNPISRGDTIGTVGDNPCGGYSVGPHLHFALFQGNNEVPIRFSDASVQSHGGYVRPSKRSGSLKYLYLAEGVAPVPADDALKQPGPSPFPDVSPSNPFYREIVLLQHLGVFGGYADGSFQPNEYVTRGQMAKIIVLAIGKDKRYSSTTCIFQDVCGNNAFYHYIRRLVELGIVSGSNDKFEPDIPVERGQFAKMATYARVAAGYDNNYPSYSTCSPPFVDVPCNDTFYDEIRRLKEIFAAKNMTLGYASTGRYQTGPGGIPSDTENIYKQIKRDQVAKLIVYSLDLESQLPSFWDVPNGSKFFRYVEGMVDAGLTSGCTSRDYPHPQFCVDGLLTRAEAAKFIARGLGADPNYADCTKPFPDVDCSLAGDLYRFIRYLREENIALGRTDGTFGPGEPIKRGELASLSMRALNQHGIACTVVQAPPFPDVPLSHTHVNSIGCLKELGIVSGYSNGQFNPDQAITRGESAKIMYLGFVDILPDVPQEEADVINDAPQTAPEQIIDDTTDEVEDSETGQTYITEGNDVDYVKMTVDVGTNAPPTQIDLNPAPNTDVTVRLLGSDGRLLASKQVKGAEGDTSLILQPKPASVAANVASTPDIAEQRILGDPLHPIDTKPNTGREMVLPAKSGVFVETSVALLARDYVATSSIIVNGDFEQGATGWIQQSSNGLSMIFNLASLGLQPHSGQWAAWMAGEHNEVGFIKQSFVVPANQPRLVYWHYIDSEDTCGYDFAGVVINTTVLATQNLCADAKTNGWVEVSHDLSAYAGQTIDLQLRAETDGSYLSHWLIDDVSITYQEQAPVSETVFLEIKSNDKVVGAGNELVLNAKKVPLSQVALDSATISGVTTGQTNTLYTFTAAYSPASAATPVSYNWQPEPNTGQNTANAAYSWAGAGTMNISVTISNGVNNVAGSHAVTVIAPVIPTPVPSGNQLYLPAIQR